MSERTVVAIYAVEDRGATGECLGRGSLIDPTVVLAHPPLDEQLAQLSRPLRVAIAASNGDSVEVIDVANVHVVDDDPPAIVGLELQFRSDAPHEQIPCINDSVVLADAVRAVLAASSTPPPPRSTPPSEPTPPPRPRVDEEFEAPTAGPDLDEPGFVMCWFSSRCTRHRPPCR